MPEQMDVVSSLKKISSELAEVLGEPGNPAKTVATLEAASFLINWIADGLQAELEFAAQRGRRSLPVDPTDYPGYGNPLCVHGYQFACEQCEIRRCREFEQ